MSVVPGERRLERPVWDEMLQERCSKWEHLWEAGVSSKRAGKQTLEGMTIQGPR